MYQVIIVIHVLLGLGIIGLILIQQGKGADAGATFGAGASGSVFGAQGAASFLSRTTATLAALFFITSLGLAILNSKQGAAYDLMTAAPATKDSSGMPDIAVPKTTEISPNASTGKPEEMPTVPSTAATGQPTAQDQPLVNPAMATKENVPPATPKKTESK
ncbi:MAG: preprotein translocase subunit SecG [Methylovulum sp.]|nr:preprotein translocase subunit SecG [Methylovulum sp.]